MVVAEVGVGRVGAVDNGLERVTLRDQLPDFQPPTLSVFFVSFTRHLFSLPTTEHTAFRPCGISVTGRVRIVF